MSATTNPGSMTQAEMMKEIERLQAANAALAAKGTPRLAFKVSPKGALSVYGMGKWPVTLYRSQWEKLLGMDKDIRKFIADNATTLVVKQ